jgi:hypothetical protein
VALIERGTKVVMVDLCGTGALERVLGSSADAS